MLPIRLLGRVLHKSKLAVGTSQPRRVFGEWDRLVATTPRFVLLVATVKLQGLPILTH